MALFSSDSCAPLSLTLCSFPAQEEALDDDQDNTNASHAVQLHMQSLGSDLSAHLMGAANAVAALSEGEVTNLPTPPRTHKPLHRHTYTHCTDPCCLAGGGKAGKKGDGDGDGVK